MRRILARYIFVRSKDTKIRDFFRQIICVAFLKSLCSERLCADSVAKYVQLESKRSLQNEVGKFGPNLQSF